MILLPSDVSIYLRRRRKLMNVFHQRHLSLSRKKSLFAPLTSDFHFLGVNYSGTQPSNHIINRCDTRSHVEGQIESGQNISNRGVAA